MRSISDLFDKFRSVGVINQQIKKITIEVIKKEIGIKLTTKYINVSRGIVYINTKPAYKSAIVIKKQLILERINAQLNKETIIDIH